MGKSQPRKTEMVFLPYRAAMWDSLESIYLAAKDDPNCDAYVIPIPFYEVNKDGSAGATHYDGALFPDNIPITDWREYDISARRPDAIFIHCPYDNVANFSIHPDFYTKKLRRYCNTVVYVPYYGLLDENSDYEYFMLLPGVMYANYVVLQSEKVRQAYIDFYIKFDKEHGLQGILGNPHEKFLALGTPKLDKLINSKKEDFDLPEEWAAKIIKPDGTRKKVILYNTHWQAWLNGGEQYFKKIRHVFDTFRSRDDVVLWWRPHPNTEKNFRTMQPQWLEKYREVVGGYKNESRGIYDDSPHLHRSMTWSDAYYGDLSSLVTLFGATGKPIVIQHVLEKGNDILFRFADFAIDSDGDVWAFELFQDGLFKLDFENNTAQLILQSDVMSKCMGKPVPSHRYIKIHCIGEMVVCFPCFIDNILVYNRNTRTSKMIPLNHDFILPYDYEGFGIRFAPEYNGKIYAFGSLSKAIIVFDTKTNSIKYDTLLFDNIGLLTDNKIRIKHPLYMSECCSEGKVTLLMRNCEHIISYTLATQDVEFIASNPVLANCVYACFDGQSFWLLSEKNEKLTKWDLDTNKTVDYVMATDGIRVSTEDSFFSGIEDCGDYLLLFPAFGDTILKFEKAVARFSEYWEMPIPNIDNESKIVKYDRPKLVGDKVYAFARHNYTIYELDKGDDEITAHRFRKWFGGYFDNIHSETRESKFGNIAGFFTDSIDKESNIDVKRRNAFLNNFANKNGTAGKVIYEHVCKEIKI